MSRKGMVASIKVKGLKEIKKRFGRGYRAKFESVVAGGLDASLHIIHSEIPAYPMQIKPPSMGGYRRTGMTGRSLGSGMFGGPLGPPNIRTAGSREARFGTRLHYAPYVIGEHQAPQNRHWWTLTGTVKDKAEPRIAALWQRIGEQLASALMGKGKGRKFGIMHGSGRIAEALGSFLRWSGARDY